MSIPSPDGRHGGAPEPAGFAFRYSRHGNVRRYGVALLLVIALALWEAGGDDVLLVIGISLGLGAATYAFYRALCRYVPTLPDGKLVRVDADGLTIGHWALPASRLGGVVEVDAGSAHQATHTLDALTFIRCEVDGRRTARMRMIYPFWHEYPAVMVEDVEAADRQRRWWLVAVPDHVDQGEFAAALRAVRSIEMTDPEGP